MGWPFPFAKRAIRMRCVTDESRKVSSVILQKYQRHNILQKAEYLSRVSLPMNDPIPPRPRAAITGDSRLGTHGSSRPPASRPRQHAHHRATARAVRCPLQATGGRATLQPSSLHVAGRPASQPVVQLQGPSAAPAPGTHPPARAVPRVHTRAGIQQQLRQHVISRHSTREDRSEPIAGAVSGAARLALHRHAVCHHRGGRGVRALRRLMGRSS